MPLLPALLIVVLSFSTGGFLPPEWAASRRAPGFTALVAAVLILGLALRLFVVERPFANWNRLYLAGAGSLGLLAVWVLLSGNWSHAPARAILDYDRVLLYLLAFVLSGMSGRRDGDLRLLVRAIAVAVFAVSLVALTTRLLPDVWQIAPATANARLSYPLPYWNALGLLTAIGFVLCFSLTCDDQETATGRMLAACALPVLGATLLLTFSRGAIVAAGIAVLAAIVVGRPRALLSGLAVAVPTVAASTVAAYAAGGLASAEPTSVAAAAQGHGVAVVVVVCVGLAGWGRRRLLPYDAHLRRAIARISARISLTTTTAAMVAAAIVLLMAVPTVLHVYRGFVADTGRDGADLRGRLNGAGDNGRADLWRLALEAFRDSPVRGQGAGTFALQLDHRSDGPLKATDAHGLFFEVLGELGLVGFALICCAVLVVLGGFLGAARNPDRAVGGALFAAGLAWTFHAASDWMWEVPAVTCWFFAAGGLVLARSRVHGVARGSPRLALPARLTGVACCVALLILPARVYLADVELTTAGRAFQRGACDRAIAHAERSVRLLSARPEPHILLGYCHVRMGQGPLAMRDMNDAVRRDPENWETHYGLAIARAASGLDPRPRLRIAVSLRPRDPRITPAQDLLARTELQRFTRLGADSWRRLAFSAPAPLGPPP